MMRGPESALFADALACEGVRKRFGGRAALDGVSLRVRRGEFVALLGPNGAGKTTLFQILAGLFVQDEGQVEVMGADMREAPVQALARIGIVFQQPAIDLDLSVAANLRFHADLHGLPRRESDARIAPLLDHLGLAEWRGILVRELSGGNRRKVELVRALLHQPDLLLMDEATVGLDPASRMQIVTEARRLATLSRVGVLWATHLVHEVEASDRVVVLHRGLVRFDGPPADLMRAAGGGSLEAAFLSLTGTPGQEMRT
ncbi:ABC transporter ATP-binding protein [Cupriavidus basilensis]|uniref:ABC transporter ATP-binding protein n=1 Tax=Cupriavidus basilensis TaxID=68895 RepID=UPI002851E0DA|nr:ABC transporter ATP-binding protein [Cupriavidus basilensis]MDR3384386.1 ABC transporter ATP-binding protein [Cupriavidus basilensis]